MDQIIEALRKTDYFAELSEPVLQSLAQRIKTRHFEKGETIFEVGSVGNAMFVIGAGEVKIALTSSTNQEITLALLTVGDAFGELSLLDGGPRSANAIADSDVELLGLYREDFVSLIETDAAALQGLMHVLAQVIRQTNQRVVDAAMLDVAGRVSKVLLMMIQRHGEQTDDGVKIKRQLSYQDIASMSLMYTAEAENVMEKYQYDSVVERLDDGLWLVRNPDVLQRAVEAVV